MVKRKTCAHCGNLKTNELMGGLISYCAETDFVVPHAAEKSEDGTEFISTYWRVPLSCPLSDSLAIKSADQVPEKDWVIIRTSPS